MRFLAGGYLVLVALAAGFDPAGVAGLALLFFPFTISAVFLLFEKKGV